MAFYSQEMFSSSSMSNRTARSVADYRLVLHSQFSSQDLFQINSPLMMPTLDDNAYAFDKPIEDFLAPMQNCSSPSHSYESSHSYDSTMYDCEVEEVERIFNLREEEIYSIVREPIPFDIDGHVYASTFIVEPTFKPEEICNPPSPDIDEPPNLLIQEEEMIDHNENLMGDKIEPQKKKIVKVQLPKGKKTRKPRKVQQSNIKKVPARKRANRSVHLWEFLRGLLNSGTTSHIQWLSEKDGTFRLTNSGAVARLWGESKNRKNMTYEKMSRALRYYYQKEILERVPNARLIYKFGSRTKEGISEESEI